MERRTTYEDGRRAGFWPIRLRSRSSAIPIPVSLPDDDARLDLQATVDRLYDAAGYEDDIDGSAPDPPLALEGPAWA